jgi:hypothetical protein
LVIADCWTNSGLSEPDVVRLTQGPNVKAKEKNRILQSLEAEEEEESAKKKEENKRKAKKALNEKARAAKCVAEKLGLHKEIVPAKAPEDFK